MATLESDDSNIIDGETINLRLVVYPILAAIILILGGFGYYYYQQNERNNEEAAARAALIQAQTPEALVQVADQFPHTDQATLALLKAADDSFGKLDYTAAAKDYQRVIDTANSDPLLRDSAQLGLASCLEANGKIDDAITAYLEVAHRGDQTPYAPFGYNAVSRIYAQRGDVENERKILTEETSLDPDSEFVKQAQEKLREMNGSTIPLQMQNSPAVPAKP